MTSSRRGLLAVMASALVYGLWLGANWLPAPCSSVEIPVTAARVWDLQRELSRSGHIPWWTPAFMNGSSQALNYAHGLIMVPWAFLGTVFDLIGVGKLLSLIAMGLSGVTMFFCAKRMLGNERAAIAAALAFMLHPLLLTRAAGTEHVRVVASIPLVPLVWLLFAKMLEGGRLAQAASCALALVTMLWADNKHTTVFLPFLLAFAVWSVVRDSEWAGRLRKARTLGALAVMSLLLAAFILVPTLSEMSLFKLFRGAPSEATQSVYPVQGIPFAAWQEYYSVRSLPRLFQRSPDNTNYLGIIWIVLAGAAIVSASRHKDAKPLTFVAGCLAAAIALGHGPHVIGSAVMDSWKVADSAGQASRTAIVVFLLAFACFAVVFWRRILTTTRRRQVALLIFAGFLFVPWFRLLEVLPIYAGIRAPEVFFQVPGVFFGALLVGFFVSDLLERPRWARLKPANVLTVLAGLFLVDAWPFQGPMLHSAVAASTIANARTMYARLGEQAKQTPGKVYVITSRPFHQMSESWGGPPVVSETAFQWMAPLEAGRLSEQAPRSPLLQRAYMDLVGVRWMIFDKSDPYHRSPGFAAQLANFRRMLPTEMENEDFAVLRIPEPRPYVSGYRRAAIAYGDLHLLPELAMALANEGYLLTEAPRGQRIEGTPPEALAPFAMVYLGSIPEAPLAREVASKIAVLAEDQPRMPPKMPRDDALSALSVTRPSAERISASFVAEADCTAVIAESYYPYWHATLDGRPVEVRRVAYGLMGVTVTAGPHELMLSYQVPRTYAWSAAISVLSLLSLIALVIVDRRSRRAQVT